jgi:hypothetical protein
MAVRIQMRRGTTTQWNNADPILNEGEIGYNTTLAAFKVGDGSTIWSELDYYQTAASITPAEVGAIALTEKGAANGVADLDGDKNVITASKVVFEGATANEYETYIQLGAEPAVADTTFTLPTTSGTIALTSDLSAYALLTGATFSGAITINGDLTVTGTTTTIDTQNLQVEDKNIILGYGSTSDAAVDGGGITLTGATNKTFNWVDATDAWTSSEHINLASGKSYYMNGTLLKDVSETLTNKSISGSSNTLTNIPNNALTNSSITINGSSVSLGGSVSITGLPSQTGNEGKYLTTDGTNASWATVSSYSAPTLGSTTITSGATVTTISGLTLASGVGTTAFTLNATAELRFADTDSSHYVGFKAPGTVSTNRIWTLPSTDGTSGQTLSTNGSGTLSWSTPAAGAAFSEMLLVGC